MVVHIHVFLLFCKIFVSSLTSGCSLLCLDFIICRTVFLNLCCSCLFNLLNLLIQRSVHEICEYNVLHLNALYYSCIIWDGSRDEIVIFLGKPELDFLKSLWGLGTEEEKGYRTGPPGYIGWRNSFLGIDSGTPYTFKNTGPERCGNGNIKILTSVVPFLPSRRQYMYVRHLSIFLVKLW